jgi:hypothetical protein
MPPAAIKAPSTTARKTSPSHDPAPELTDRSSMK